MNPDSVRVSDGHGGWTDGDPTTPRPTVVPAHNGQHHTGCEPCAAKRAANGRARQWIRGVVRRSSVQEGRINRDPNNQGDSY